MCVRQPVVLVIYDSLCLTDCRQSASEHNSESLQPDNRDFEDGGETSIKEEDKCGFMDFPVREVAEQLTRLDAVGFNNKYLEPVLMWASESLIHCPCFYVLLRNCSSECCPSTAWAVSGPSVTRKKTETWHPPSAPPSPSLTPSPTVSSPHSSVRPYPALWLPLLSHRPGPRLPSCIPPLARAHLPARRPAPPTEHESSRGG